MFLMVAVAERVPAQRPGARHSLMVFATGSDFDHAQSEAVEFASNKGWTMIEQGRSKEIDVDTEIIADDTLRSAAESAVARGSALVVYQDEIRPDA